MTNSLSKLLLPALLLGLFILNFIFVINQPWFGDFWVHAALVHTLQSYLFPLRDPFINDYSAQIPYWPYEAMVAVFSNIFKLNAIDGLVVFSFINLTLLVFAIRRFCLTWHPSPLFFLFFFVFMLGCWGTELLGFSAFFHAGVFFYVLSYPSTFAFALALLGISRISENSSAKNTGSFFRPADVLITTLLLLTHPLTFIFYCCSVLPLLLCAGRLRSMREIAHLILLLGIPVIAWIFWPPFPLGEFLRNRSFTDTVSAKWLYDTLGGMIGLAWPIFLILVLRNSPPRHARIEFTIFLLSMIFFFGYLFENWNYSRMISFIMIMLQLGATREIFDSNQYTPRFAIVRKGVSVMLLAASLLQTFYYFNGMFNDGPVVRYDQSRLIWRLSAVQQRIPENEVLLAGAAISKVLPALGKRVFVFDVEPCFRAEYSSRRRQQKDFFHPASPMSNRFQTIRDNAITTIIIDRTVPDEAAVADALVKSDKFESVDLSNELTQLTVKPDPYLTLFQFRKDRHAASKTVAAAPASR